jgi:hypothetical protein
MVLSGFFIKENKNNQNKIQKVYKVRKEKYNQEMYKKREKKVLKKSINQ